MESNLKFNSHKDIYALIGYAIAEWQNIETGLLINYWGFIGDASFPVVTSAFFAVTSFSAKLEMTKKAGVMALQHNQKLQKEWEILCNRCEKLNNKRNHIAHFSLHSAPLEMPSGSEAIVGPHFLNTAAILRWGNKPPTYNKTQLKSLINETDILFKDLMEFSEIMGKQTSS